MIETEIRARIYIRLSIVYIFLSAMMLHILLSVPEKDHDYAAMRAEFMLYDTMPFYILLFELISKKRGSFIHIIMLFYFIPVIFHNGLQLSTMKKLVLAGVTLLKAGIVHALQYSECEMTSHEVFTTIKIRLVAVQTASTSIRKLMYVICLNNIFRKLFFGILYGESHHHIVFLATDGISEIIETRNSLAGYLTRVLGTFVFIGIKCTTVMKENMAENHSELFSLFIAIIYIAASAVHYELKVLKIVSRAANAKPTL